MEIKEKTGSCRTGWAADEVRSMFQEKLAILYVTTESGVFSHFSRKVDNFGGDRFTFLVIDG